MVTDDSVIMGRVAVVVAVATEHLVELRVVAVEALVVGGAVEVLLIWRVHKIHQLGVDRVWYDVFEGLTLQVGYIGPAIVYELIGMQVVVLAHIRRQELITSRPLIYVSPKLWVLFSSIRS